MRILLLFATSAIMMFAFIADGECSFRALTGVICPGCGLMRSIKAIFLGDFHSSLRLHLFGPIFILAWLASILYFLQIIKPKHRRIFVSSVIVVGLFLIYWIIRVMNHVAV